MGHITPPPSPHYTDATITLYHGDCLDVLRALPDSSADSVVCDPPYGLEFMGKEWDAPWKQGADVHADARTLRAEEMTDESKRRFIASAVNKYAAGLPFQQWCQLWATECLRVLKPGGHLLAFGGTRTWHRLACAIEDAGFEVRDSIAWMYGSGFPKSLDVSKAIDKAAGAERAARNGSGEHVGTVDFGMKNRCPDCGKPYFSANPCECPRLDCVAVTDEACAWQGWGTALKPAHEPIVVARKPLAGTVAQNVLTHGTGALNVDGCRIAGEPRTTHADGNRRTATAGPTLREGLGLHDDPWPAPAGRWPANVILDESQAEALDEQSGDLHSQDPRTRSARRGSSHWGGVQDDDTVSGAYADQGGASRFFYVAKADASERPFFFRPTCECEDAWPTRTGSPARATDATTEPGSSSTSKPGSATTGAPSLTDTTSTTSTGTSSTTTPTTSSQSPRPITSESTPAANSETASGGSPVGSVASSSRSASLTGISAGKGGRSTDGAAPATLRAWSNTSVCGNCGAPTRREAHATVKPLALMRWLVRLVTPPGGTVLEPFAGSGTTVEACILEGLRCVAIEREADYLPLIVQRINRRRDPVAAVRSAGEDGGLFDLLDGESA